MLTPIVGLIMGAMFGACLVLAGLTDPDKIIEYPPTIRVSHATAAQGVTLSCLTFFGEFFTRSLH